MTDNSNEVIRKKIASAIQKIQDNVVVGAKGLDRTEVREHIVFWELGVLLREFVKSASILPDNVNEELEKNFKQIEKKIRSDGIRRGKEPLPSWEYKNQTVKPPKMQEPSITWVLISWDFIDNYQDLERWNLVADISGAMFKEGFVRKRAEELIQYFSKKHPIPNAKKLQDKFVKEISKFDKNPSRKEFGSESSQGLIPQIFGKNKIDINLARKYFFEIRANVEELLQENQENEAKRTIFSKNVGIEQIKFLRRLLRLISITDEQKYQKRLRQIEKDIPRQIKTKHSESKELYSILYSLIREEKSREKFLHRVTGHDLGLLNTKLSAVATPEGFLEYKENQKSREELFN